MDIFHLQLGCKICNVFEKTKINEKEAGVGPILNSFKYPICGIFEFLLGRLAPSFDAILLCPLIQSDHIIWSIFVQEIVINKFQHGPVALGWN